MWALSVGVGPNTQVERVGEKFDSRVARMRMVDVEDANDIVIRG